ncbi:MAG TPA: tail fiber protein [Candidatus Methylomirabilis sp.]|nr:tail fiber protein [Candidatus Methylomirabilis sp.]
MAEPYVGEIRMFGGNFAPAGWLFCDGSLLPISEYTTLFQLIGTTYGGDGQSTFALPDLRGRIPIHQGQGAGLSPRQIGESGGSESVTLTSAQLANHSHAFPASTSAASSGDPLNAVVADTGTASVYSTGSPNVAMSPGAITVAGGSQPHDNMMPFVCVSFIISLFGIFPTQN